MFRNGLRVRRAGAGALAVLLVAGLQAAPQYAGYAMAAGSKEKKNTATSAEVLQMLSRIEALRKEVRELRNLIEVYGFELRNLRQHQGDVYNDLDARLRLQEGNAPGGAAPPGAKNTTRRAPSSVVAAAPPALRRVSKTPVSPAPAVASAIVRVPAPKPAATAAVKPATAEAQQVYDDAFTLVRKSRYSDAVAAFTVFLKKYPDTELSDDAQYWIAESHYITHSFDKALRGFRAVQRYARSKRIPDARLKIGYIQERAGARAEARATFSSIIKDFPGSRTANLSRSRLQRLEQRNN